MIAAVAAIVLSVLAASRALSRPHGVAATYGWLLAIFALPWVGALMYFAVASPYLPRTRARRRRKTMVPAPADALGPPPDPDGLFRLCETLTGLPPTTGNRITWLGSGAPAFEQLEDAIAHARHSIRAEYYIIQDDETGGRFLDLLTERAQAGVQVHLLYDALGSARLDSDRLAQLINAGGEVSSFLPLNPLRRRWSVHLRNHRKLVIIDGARAFTGGMNVGDEYAGRRTAPERFHDALVAIEGPLLEELGHVFIEDWAYATETVLKPGPLQTPLPEGCAAAVIQSGPDQRTNAHHYGFFALITSARHRLWLTSPYFVPDALTLKALIAAALRGVDVRIIVPTRAKMDVPLVGWATRATFAPLVEAGVQIFEYAPSMLHAKTLLVDDATCLVGSANLDVRSMRLNFEMSVLAIDTRLAIAMAQRFEADLERSTPITATDLATHGRLRRLGYRLARLLSPLM
jgi:cardiolipin synthase